MVVAAFVESQCGKLSYAGNTQTFDRQMMDYNVPGGKLNRGMAVYDVLAALKGAEVGGASDHWPEIQCVWGRMVCLHALSQVFSWQWEAAIRA
jgi:hypothetical protein